MSSRSTSSASAVGGRAAVVALGATYVALGLGTAVSEAAAGRALSNVILVASFVTVPGVILVAGGARLPATGIDSQYYPVVAVWCLSGVGVMLASVGLYQLEPAESIAEPMRAAVVLTAFGGVAGFAAGSRDGLARTREQALQQRNEELERTEATLEDTVERLEEANAELAESNERLDEFASVVSHDLQEPLRTVSSYLTLLEERHGDDLDGDAAEFLAYAVDGADRMGAMVDGLLELSRVQTRGREFEPVDLDLVLREVRRDLELRIAETDATVEVEDLPDVVGDREQLGQLFQNLLGNAIEYSGDDPPRVTVSVDRVDGRTATVSVSDEGIGIDPADQERIFGVFQRLHSREKYSGTGIGLALCERIVERHGGTITVDSEPGEGATFSVTLPRTRDALP